MHVHAYIQAHEDVESDDMTTKDTYLKHTNQLPVLLPPLLHTMSFKQIMRQTVINLAHIMHGKSVSDRLLKIHLTHTFMTPNNDMNNISNIQQHDAVRSYMHMAILLYCSAPIGQTTKKTKTGWIDRSSLPTTKEDIIVRERRLRAMENNKKTRTLLAPLLHPRTHRMHLPYTNKFNPTTIVSV